MNEEKIKLFEELFNKLLKIFSAVLALFMLVTATYKGYMGESSLTIFSGFLVGLVSALIVIVAFALIDYGLVAWDKSTEWLVSRIRKHPNFRRWVMFPGVLISFFTPYIIFKSWEAEISLKIFVSIYFALVLPAAIFSFIRDDNKKERSQLSKRISREIRIENPQAAIQNAFIIFEDRLLKRFPEGTQLYGNRLIQAAYQGSDSLLVYKSKGKDYTHHLHNLMSGAYCLYRNPRQHIIVEDDEEKAQTIIDLVEQLIEFVDDSVERNSPE